jgi:hypothetical protein
MEYEKLAGMTRTLLNTPKAERWDSMQTLMQSAKELLQALVKKCESLVAKVRQLSKRS